MVTKESQKSIIQNKSSLISEQSAESFDDETTKHRKKKTISFQENHLGLPETANTQQVTLDDRILDQVLIRESN